MSITTDNGANVVKATELNNWVQLTTMLWTPLASGHRECLYLQ